MKKWIGAAVMLALLWSIRPFRPVDAGELIAVETLLVERTNAGVTLSAGGQTGTGETVEEALERLTENVPGTLFLRQVRRVIFCGAGWDVEMASALPEELPMGALLYTSPKSIQVLNQWEDLNQTMAAREQRGERTENLAEIKNRSITQESRGKKKK